MTWDIRAAAECPSIAELEAAVEIVLSHPVFSGDRCDIQVKGSVYRSSSGGWAADLRFSSRNGNPLGVRHLEGLDHRCTALRGPIALVIALMVESTEQSTTLSEPAASPTEERAEQRRAARYLAVLTEGRAAVGFLPGLNFGSVLGLDASAWLTLPGRGELALWFPTSSHESNPGGRFWGWHAGMALCPPLGAVGPLNWAFCAGVELGMIHGSGFGLDENESATRAYAQGDARVAAGMRLFGPVGISAQLGLAVPWVRSRFVYQDASNMTQVLHQPKTVIPFVGLGLSWQLSTSSYVRGQSSPP